MPATDEKSALQRISPYGWAWLLFAVVLLAASADSAMRQLWVWLTASPEYSHGLIIPIISAYLIWQQRPAAMAIPPGRAWSGLAVVCIGLLGAWLGRAGAIYTVQQLAVVTVLLGLIMALVGRQRFLALRMPLLLLFFVVPPPPFLQQNLSAGMQLLSSRIGVWFIRLCGISVYLEGNVIDLGVYRLQVAEACDGLRYLFPLMTLGFIASYLFQAALWKRVLLFASTIPLTILMNSVRIGAIGLTVDRWGVAMAEGLLHAFEGWLVFMVTCVLLMLEMMLLARIGPNRRPWREVFGFIAPAPVPTGTRVAVQRLPTPFWISVALVLVYSAIAWATPQQRELQLNRRTFAEFPSTLGAWQGRRDTLDAIYTEALQLDDYYYGNFNRGADTPVNLYIAWYDSQQGGRSAHSPRSCLPGGGWRIETLTQIDVPGAQFQGRPLRVNRVLIALGNQRQLVYYWFQQRGRIVTDEYAAKWYLLQDALSRHRTDGALVRLVIPVANPLAVPAAEAELARFAAALAPTLPPFVPQ